MEVNGKDHRWEKYQFLNHKWVKCTFPNFLLVRVPHIIGQQPAVNNHSNFYFCRLNNVWVYRQ